MRGIVRIRQRQSEKSRGPRLVPAGSERQPGLCSRQLWSVTAALSSFSSSFCCLSSLTWPRMGGWQSFSLKKQSAHGFPEALRALRSLWQPRSPQHQSSHRHNCGPQTAFTVDTNFEFYIMFLCHKIGFFSMFFSIVLKCKNPF